ncbi:MAG: DUF3459 domain-containing protein [Acidobacteria bacterium]|nr:DUF3459 domain-containing protein [Acidobacteriota bacterium]
MRFHHLLASCVLVATSFSAGAQMLARPGWKGNGLSEQPWWKNAVIYEIYPRSFQDSDGDGVGDIKGITSRLDYLQSLGVDAIWLTPIFPSPQKDFGYDIADFTSIDPQFGTMEDFDELVSQASRRNIRVIMDLVLNHTSDKHPWFVESASSKDNPKRNWYVWRDGKDGSTTVPPNNWLNRIQQSAWQFDPKTKQFYYHYFAVEQPDLNWRNPDVEKAMFDVARFWLNRGVAGFRLDAVNTMFEDAQFRDAPPLPGTNEYGEPARSQEYQRNQPEVHDVMKALRKVTDSANGQRVLIGEVYTGSTAEMATWFGAKHDEIQLPMDTSLGFLNKRNAAAFRKKMTEAQQLKLDTPLFVFDNHDRPRSWDRYGDGEHNAEIAKVIATILLASRSSALIYQGQEIGMKTTPPTRKEDVRDPRGLAGWPKEKGRDGERTPMQWNPGENAGFTTGKPWLPIPADYTQHNVELEQKAKGSVLNWFHDLIALRRANPSLHEGEQVMLDQDAQNALVWVRRSAKATKEKPPVVVACNFSAQPVTLQLKKQVTALGIRGSFMRSLLRTDGGMGGMNLDEVKLPPFGVFIGEVRY